MVILGEGSWAVVYHQSYCFCLCSSRNREVGSHSFHSLVVVHFHEFCLICQDQYTFLVAATEILGIVYSYEAVAVGIATNRRVFILDSNVVELWVGYVC